MFRLGAVVAPFLLICLPFIDLYVLYGIGSDVLKHQLVVTVKKLFAVEQKCLHELSVHFYLAALVQLNPRELGYQGIEHRSLRKLECIRIEYHSIPFVVEFYFRCGDCHLVEHPGSPLKIDCRNLSAFLPFSYLPDIIYHSIGCISFANDIKDIGRILALYRYGEAGQRKLLSVLIHIAAHSYGICLGAFLITDQYHSFNEVCLSDGFLYFSIQIEILHL